MSDEQRTAYAEKLIYVFLKANIEIGRIHIKCKDPKMKATLTEVVEKLKNENTHKL